MRIRREVGGHQEASCPMAAAPLESRQLGTGSPPRGGCWGGAQACLPACAWRWWWGAWDLGASATPRPGPAAVKDLLFPASLCPSSPSLKPPEGLQPTLVPPPPRPHRELTLHHVGLATPGLQHHLPPPPASRPPSSRPPVGQLAFRPPPHTCAASAQPSPFGEGGLSGLLCSLHPAAGTGHSGRVCL